MRYIDGFSNPGTAATLVQRIREHGAALAAAGRTATLMEVCGSHTMAIARHGIRDLLPPNVRLVSGPGCPVCVTPPGYVDTALELARRGIVLGTFGDMLYVPGSHETLAQCRAEGGKLLVCYSPLAALEEARTRPECEVVFLAVGFETTIAPIAGVLDTAIRQGVKNLSFLTALKVVPPALEALLSDPALKIDAFLCPAHVSAIIGAHPYQAVVDAHRVPCVIAGFEPLDILLGIEGILAQLVAREARVDNQYSRVVRPEGNTKAQALMRHYLEASDAVWRGVGVIPGSGLSLRPEYASYDASVRHGIDVGPGLEPPGCRCGEVIKGQLQPSDCPLFGTRCRPESAVGPCMVSSEGSCAAHFKYRSTARTHEFSNPSRRTETIQKSTPKQTGPSHESL